VRRGSRTARWIAFVACLGCLVALTAGCTSGKGKAPGSLSGTWSGRYRGAVTGTFQLSWQQAGSDLSGTITLSAQPGPEVLTGTVSGDTIYFGTVGSSQAITYSGKVSGNSMSGTYKIDGAPGGPWSATKS
jgi:hypothetical protein